MDAKLLGAKMPASQCALYIDKYLSVLCCNRHSTELSCWLLTAAATRSIVQWLHFGWRLCTLVSIYMYLPEILIHVTACGHSRFLRKLAFHSDSRSLGLGLKWNTQWNTQEGSPVTLCFDPLKVLYFLYLQVFSYTNCLTHDILSTKIRVN